MSDHGSHGAEHGGGHGGGGHGGDFLVEAGKHLNPIKHLTNIGEMINPATAIPEIANVGADPAAGMATDVITGILGSFLPVEGGGSHGGGHEGGHGGGGHH